VTGRTLAGIPNPIDVVTDAIGAGVGWAFDEVAEGIAQWVLGAVEFFVNGAIDFLRTSSSPDVESAWFAGPESPYATVRTIAVLLLAGCVFLGIIQGLLHGDGVGLVRRMAGALPVAVAGMVITTSVVGYLLELTDALSAAVLQTTDEQALHFLSGFGLAISGVATGFAAVILGLVAVLAALLLWIELMVRASLVYLLVAISPLGFAAMVWPSARGFLRKTVEILVAVILSKFVICVALAVGVAGLSGAGQADAAGEGIASDAGAGMGTLLVGAVLLGLAAFSPFLVLKLIPVAESALVAQGISRGPAHAAQTGMSTYSTGRSVARLSGSGATGSSSIAAAPSTASMPLPAPGGAGVSAVGGAAAGGVATVVAGSAKVAGAAAQRAVNAADQHAAPAKSGQRPLPLEESKGDDR
jgi:hypothetical protein